MSDLPIGLLLTRTARAVNQAFERAMAEAGGSAATWQVLSLLRQRDWGNQRELAEAMGVTSATMTQHLRGLEAQGLIARRRHDANRRILLVELTDAGRERFDQLRAAAAAHDAQLRAALTEEELAALRGALARLAGAVEARH